ncbi:MAG: elongation factor G [Dehalococcoidia bacterium]
MRSYKTESIRNVVLLSHSGAGKTSLSEAILFNAGAINRLGRVDAGNTTSDYEPEETQRQSSIQTSVLPWEWNDVKVNTIDTPGYADFVGEALAALRVADAAIITICAASGIEVGTELMWKEVEARRLPTLIVLNKMDRENADFHKTLESIQEQFGRRCTAVQLPIGAEASFKGVIDLLSMKSYGTDGKEETAPDDLVDQAQQLRETMAEAVAEVNDELTTKYLEGEELTEEELRQGLAEGTKSGAIVPVLAASALHNVGIRQVMDAVSAYLPSLLERPASTAKDLLNDQDLTLSGDGDAPLAAQVFKTTADPYVGKLSYFRVYSNALFSDSQVWNATKSSAERVSQLFMARGKSQEPVNQVMAGDIGAVAKLTESGTGDTLCNKDRPVLLEKIDFPPSLLSVAVKAKTKADVDKMGTSLARLVEEDPTLRLEKEPDTGEMLLSGMGEAHIDVTIQKLKRKFSVSVNTDVPQVPYKETISVFTKAEYKHRKQTGGHGQYGHVLLELEPKPRGTGMEFARRVVGGNVPKNYIPAVEKGVMEAAKEGVMAHYPMVDVKVTLYDGSSHQVDSSDMSFKIAGSHAFKKGAAEANPTLLEPVVKLEVTVPDSFTGDVIGDLNSKRGKVLGMTPRDGLTVVEAEAPLAEVLKYAVDLRSMTQGRGSYTTEFLRYEEVPVHIAQKIMERANKGGGSG